MKTRRIELSEAERAELEKGYRKGERHCFRMRCLTLLFKSEGLSSARVGERVGMNKRMIMSTESITAAKVAGFLDRLSFKPRTRNTVVALDNVSVHLCHTIKELRPVWKKGNYSFFSSRHTRRTSTSPRPLGESSRANGSTRRTTSPQTLSFTQTSGLWLPSANSSS